MLGFPFTKVFILSQNMFISFEMFIYIKCSPRIVFSKNFHTVDVQNPKQPPRMMIIPFIYRVEKPSKRWLALGFLDHQQYLPKICSEARLERGHKGIAFRTATGIGWILGFLIRNGGLIEGGVGLAACWFCGFRGGGGGGSQKETWKTKNVNLGEKKKTPHNFVRNPI